LELIASLLHGCDFERAAAQGSNHIYRDLPTFFDHYENRRRVHTMGIENSPPRRYRMPGNRNIMFLIIGALIVVVGVLGYNLYEAKKEPKGVQINVGPEGLKIQNK
jgi:hypothetical protein